LFEYYKVILLALEFKNTLNPLCIFSRINIQKKLEKFLIKEMLRHFLFFLAAFYIANGMKGVKQNSKLNSTQHEHKTSKTVLFISSNHRPDHFRMNCAFANVLAKQYNLVC